MTRVLRFALLGACLAVPILISLVSGGDATAQTPSPSPTPTPWPSAYPTPTVSCVITEPVESHGIPPGTSLPYDILVSFQTTNSISITGLDHSEFISVDAVSAIYSDGQEVSYPENQGGRSVSTTYTNLMRASPTGEYSDSYTLAGTKWVSGDSNHSAAAKTSWMYKRASQGSIFTPYKTKNATAVPFYTGLSSTGGPGVPGF